MNKLVTISIAAYNVEKYLNQTLDSLCDSRILDDIEVIVVDDGSKDNTYKIAEKYTQKYPRTFIAVHKENGGWGSTVNYSIKHAGGKYFRILDGDDLVNTQNFVEFLKKLKEFDADVFFSPYIRFDDESGKIIESFFSDKSNLVNKIININEINKKNFAMHSLTFATDLLRKNKISLMENCFYTDAEYIAKAMSFVNTAVVTDLPVYKYRIGREGQSVSIEGLKKHYSDAEKVARELVCFSKSDLWVNNDFLNEQTKRSIVYSYQALVISNHKDNLCEFDLFLKNAGLIFYDVNNIMISFLRKSNFKNVDFVSNLLQKKIQLANWVKKVR